MAWRLKIDQVRPGPTTSSGTAGVSRRDLWQNQVLNVHAVWVNEGDGASPPAGDRKVRFVFLDVPPSSTSTFIPIGGTGISSGTDADGNPYVEGLNLFQVNFTPDYTLYSYRIGVLVDGGGRGRVDARIACCRFTDAGVLLNRGWRFPASEEGSSAEILESNFSDLTTAQQNRKFLYDYEFMLADILSTIGGGGGAVSIAGDVTGVLTSASVVALRGRTLDAGSTPTLGDVLAWNGASIVWKEGFTRVNVKDYGAVGDDSTDDAAAIQAAIDAVNALGGGSVFFPIPATAYKITAKLRVYNNIALLGETKGFSAGALIKAYGGITAIGANDPTALTRHVRIEDITVNNNASMPASSVGIDFTGISWGQISRVSLRNHDRAIVGAGSVGGGGYYNDILACEIASNAYGIYLAAAANAFKVMGGRVNGNTTGIYSINNTGNYFNTSCEANTTAIRFATGSSGHLVSGTYFEGNNPGNVAGNGAIVFESGAQKNVEFGNMLSNGTDAVLDLDGRNLSLSFNSQARTGTGDGNNLLSNPDFSVVGPTAGIAAGWGMDPSVPAGTTLSIDTVEKPAGAAASQKYEINNTSERVLARTIKTVVGQRYVLTGWYRVEQANAFRIEVGSSAGTPTDYGFVTPTHTATWLPFRFAFVATSATLVLGLHILPAFVAGAHTARIAKFKLETGIVPTDFSAETILDGLQSVGPALASASTITPTHLIHRVSGTTAIDNIAVPNGFTGSVLLVPTGAWSTTTSGNIANVVTAVANTPIVAAYEPTTGKWYLSGSGSGATTEPLKVMFIGDSLTTGSSTSPGGARVSFMKLAERDRSIKMAGPVLDFVLDSMVLPDPRCAAYPGETIEQLGVRMDVGGSITTHVATWGEPDVVVWMAGTNDFSTSGVVATIESREDVAYGFMNTLFPNALKIVCTIPLFYSPATPVLGLATTNANIATHHANQVARIAALGDKWVLVDTCGNLTRADAGSDGVHLLSSAYGEIATKLWDEVHDRYSTPYGLPMPRRVTPRARQASALFTDKTLGTGSQISVVDAGFELPAGNFLMHMRMHPTDITNGATVTALAQCTPIAANYTVGWLLAWSSHTNPKTLNLYLRNGATITCRAPLTADQPFHLFVHGDRTNGIVSFWMGTWDTSAGADPQWVVSCVGATSGVAAWAAGDASGELLIGANDNFPGFKGAVDRFSFHKGSAVPDFDNIGDVIRGMVYEGKPGPGRTGYLPINEGTGTSVASGIAGATATLTNASWVAAGTFVYPEDVDLVATTSAMKDAFRSWDGSRVFGTLNNTGLSWLEGYGSSYTHEARTTDALPASMTFKPQWAFATATGANRVPGSLIVNLGAPTNSGTTEAKFLVQRNGTTIAALGPDSSAFGGMWLGPVTPSSSNFAFLSNGAGVTYLNTPTGGAIYLSFNGSALSAGTVDFTAAAGFNWSIASTAAGLRQSARSSDAATSNMTLAPQAPWASATLTNRTPGSLIVDLAAPTNGGTTEASLRVNRGGSHLFSAATFPGSPTVGLVWLGAITPSTTNYLFESNGSTYSALNVASGGTVYIGPMNGSATAAGVVGISAASGLFWSAASANPGLSQIAHAADTAVTRNFTIQPQHAFVTATGANRTPGSLIVNLGAPMNGGTTEAGLIIHRNGQVYARIGPYDGATYSAVWLGPNITPSSTNFAFLGNSSNWSYLNIPTGGNITLSFQGSYATAGSVVLTEAGGLAWSALSTAAGVKQADVATNSATGAVLTVQAQNATGTTSTGGKLSLKSGTGTTSTGAVEVSTGSNLRLNLKAGGTSSLTLSVAGTPEGAVTATVGSIATRSDGGSGTTLYVKESGSGNTGWVAYGGAAAGGQTITLRTTAGPVTLTGSGSAKRAVHVNRYAGNITFNLPTTGLTVGESFVFKNGWVGAYTLTVNAGTGVGHDGPGTLETYDISEGTFAEFVWDGTHWNLMR